MLRIGVLIPWIADAPGVAGPHGGLPARNCSAWAGLTAASADRRPLGRRRCGRSFENMPRNWSALAPDVILRKWQRGGGATAAGDSHRANRVHAQCRSGRCRVRREPRAAWRQRHRLYQFRIRHRCEVAGTAQGDRTGHDPSGGASRFRHGRRDPANSVPSKLLAPSVGVEVRPIDVRDAGEIERAITALRANSEWRLDCDRQRAGDRSSQSDYRAGSPAQITCGLFTASFRRGRRIDHLWT